MPDVTKANLEPLIHMLNAAIQRQDTIRQLAGQLHSDALWRSPDGTLAVELTDDQRRQIAQIAHAYLDETEVIITAARAMLAPQANPPLAASPRSPEAQAGGGP